MKTVILLAILCIAFVMAPPPPPYWMDDSVNPGKLTSFNPVFLSSILNTVFTDPGYSGGGGGVGNTPPWTWYHGDKLRKWMDRGFGNGPDSSKFVNPSPNSE
jgi:hypothetical protein